jgi:2-dehydropantoate 2-reductase
MKIAIVGCGAVGSFYGAKLLRSGLDVHFLLRSGFDTIRRRGVFIESPEGNFNVRPPAATAAEDIGLCDLVIIALKTTANHRFRDLLPPLVGPDTVLLTLQNGLGNEEQLATIFPALQIMGGLCFVCLNRLEPGLVRHTDHGLVVLGELMGWPEPRTHDIANSFRTAGVACKVTDNLARAHWEKLVWNIPFNGLGVASAAGMDCLLRGGLCPGESIGPCLTTAELLADPEWERLAHELMLEVIRAANHLKFCIPESLANKQIERTRTMGAYKASTLIDFERGQPLELDSLFLEPLRQGRAAGVEMPRLSALCSILQALETDRSRRIDQGKNS